MQTFNKRHFEEILKPCLLDRHESVRVDGETLQMPMDEQYFSVNEAGVFPGIKYNAEWLASETLLLRWRPARELDDPTIEVAETPILPFDFTAKQLAAFMLAGPGSLVADFYGDWGDGPDSASLRHIDPDSKAHTAIVQAYAVYRETEKIVGPYPLELDAKAERARKAWNDADSVTDKETKAVRGLEMEATAAEAKAAQGKWLEDMVRLLLKPAQEQTAATPAPVVADNGKKLPAWLDVTGNYIAGIMKDGQIVSAKVLYRALEAKAGPESPFDKGTGQNRGSLYVRKIAAPVSLKTMQNNWSEIRSLP